MKVVLEGISKTYGDLRAIDHLDLEIGDGEMLVLLGPSGCGKTTTMRSIVGLEVPDTGRIVVGDTPVFDASRSINVPSNKRHMGMVFQSYAIWPHKTVAENVAYPLERLSLPRAEVGSRVAEVLKMVGLADFADKGASLLSGGQMQRVAVARSVVARPRVLLLDEPLSNLDAKLREHLRFELRDIQQKLGITAVYVTHDQTEALALADRIAVMRGGRIIQLDRPEALYKNPVDTFVADFLGVGNIMPGEVVGIGADGLRDIRIDRLATTVRADTDQPVGARIFACIRPEHVWIGEAADRTAGDGVQFQAKVQVASYLGNHVRYLLGAGEGLELQAINNDPEKVLRPGTDAVVTLRPDQIQILVD